MCWPVACPCCMSLCCCSKQHADRRAVEGAGSRTGAAAAGHCEYTPWLLLAYTLSITHSVLLLQLYCCAECCAWCVWCKHTGASPKLTRLSSAPACVLLAAPSPPNNRASLIRGPILRVSFLSAAWLTVRALCVCVASAGFSSHGQGLVSLPCPAGSCGLHAATVRMRQLFTSNLVLLMGGQHIHLKLHLWCFCSCFPSSLLLLLLHALTFVLSILHLWGDAAGLLCCCFSCCPALTGGSAAESGGNSSVATGSTSLIKVSVVSGRVVMCCVIFAFCSSAHCTLPPNSHQQSCSYTTSFDNPLLLLLPVPVTHLPSPYCSCVCLCRAPPPPQACATLAAPAWVLVVTT